MQKSVPKSADIIVVGGGAAGCVLASRLAQADPDLDVLIIEAGANNKDEPTIVNPALFAANLAPGSPFTKTYLSKKSENVAGRELPVMTGNVLGGGGSVNFMIYARPVASDFADWKTDGWAPEDLIPLLKKMETYSEDEGLIDTRVHGTGGEFHVSHGGGFARRRVLTDDILQASKAVGLETVPDTQNLNDSNSISAVASWVDGKTGRRQDSAHVLVQPLLAAGTTKLRALTGYKALRVIFNEKKEATGVEVVSTDSNIMAPLAILGTKLVVLCAGALNTPQILENSGIGERKILDNLRISIIADVPGVGATYLDHQFVLINYKSKSTFGDTLDALWTGRCSPTEWVEKYGGNLGWTSMSAFGKVRPTSEELLELSPRLQALYQHDYASTGKPLALLIASSSNIGAHMMDVPPGQYFTFAIALAYGYSKGYVHATNKSEDQKPDFDTGYLSDPADLEILIWAYKRQREIARRMNNFDGSLSVSHPKFSESSSASPINDDKLVLSFGDDKTNLPDILYTAEDNSVIGDYIRQNVGTMWHSAGTCPMKPFQDGGVVDEHLNVYGVSRLKIAGKFTLYSFKCRI